MAEEKSGRALVAAAGAGVPRGYRVRRDGWTEARQRVFLRALSETGCVRDACARARISNTSAYRMRRRSAAFARAWERALACAVPTLEQAAYERAVIGWEEPVFHCGKVVGTRRRYSDSLLRVLILRGDLKEARRTGADMSPAELIEIARAAARAAGGHFSTPATAEETDRALMRNLGALKLRRKWEEEERKHEGAADDADDDGSSETEDDLRPRGPAIRRT